MTTTSASLVLSSSKDERRCLRVLVTVLVTLAVAASAHAQQPGTFLGHEEIRLLGLGMRVEPAQQTVPKDVATIVSTFLQLPASQTGDVSPFAPGTVLKGTLRGPSLTAPLPLTAAPNTPFTIPPLSVPGVHTLDDIRLEVDGQMLMRGTPESVTITVIEKLLVTQVTTRPLTAQEIRDKGIVFDRSSFQAYNFTAAFAVQDHPVQLSFPVVLPTLASASGSTAAPDATIATTQPPQPPKLTTIIPDTLAIQRTIPNLSVVGFVLSVSDPGDHEVLAPPIPGVVVIPGQIGFLDQFFSVMLMVGNAAPNGSGLVVSDLRGEILLPAGRSGVVGADDAPLRMAQTATGVSPSTQPLAQPGGDGKLGTADDIPYIGPGDTASAEYLVEGRREGTHTIEFAITGRLTGLPVGPRPITGRASGTVLVRNPSFTLTFTHPDTVQAGEPYTLDVTVTNTSSSIANVVSVALSSAFVSGASIVGDATQTIDTLQPQDSATVSFSLVSQVSGRVFAATLDSDDNVSGRFSLKTGVGELNVPVSPDSLVLPAEANSLPADVRKAALGLLGKAWSVATAPAAALPADITRFSKKIVYDRAIEVAEAGFRVTLHEPLDASVSHLLFDFSGNDFDRIATRAADASEQTFEQADYAAFDELRRKSVRGDVFATAVGGVLAPVLAANGVDAFHRQLGERVSWRAPSLSIVASTNGAGPLPVRIVVIDGAGRVTGRLDASGRATKAIPFSDVVPLGGDTTSAPSASLTLIASLPQGAYRILLEPRDEVPAVPYTLSVVYPDAVGALQQAVFASVTLSDVPSIATAPSAPWRISVEASAGAGGSSLAPSTSAIVEPDPAVLGVVQQKNADIITICSGPPLLTAQGGRIVAVLFNKEMPPASVQDSAAPAEIANYALDTNQIVGVAEQPGRRIVFLALRDPIGPYVPRAITFSGIDDGRGHSLASQSVPIEATVDHGGVVSGKALQADGTPLAGADVRLIYFGTGRGCSPIVVSDRTAAADGSFGWDYVAHLDAPGINRISVTDASGVDARAVDFQLQRDSQHLNVNVVMLGRGTFSGRTLDTDGQPLDGTAIRVSSLTDLTQVFGATSDSDGRFTISRVPVGNFLIEAVNGGKSARITATDRIPFAGSAVSRDLTLIADEVTKITVKYGAVSGHVLLASGGPAPAGLPVVAYYQSGSQTGVACPPDFFNECPVATTATDEQGAFSFAQVPAGQHRVESFNAATLQQGDARVVVPADGAASFNLQLTGGLATVHGVVVDSQGAPVKNASVGGGLTLTTSDVNGQFVLQDVPIGHVDIVAVSDALGTKGSAAIDIPRAGLDVDVVVTLDAVGTIAGRVFAADHVTPVPGVTVYLFVPQLDGRIAVMASAVTDLSGRYTMPKLPVNANYRVSAFRADFTDGNVMPAPLRYNGQVLQADIVFLGHGSIAGTVKNANGDPAAANVGVSGLYPVIAGGMVVTELKYVKNYAQTTADAAAGAFTFANVFVGDFTIEAVGAFSPDPVHASGTIPSDGALAQVELRMTPTSRITGTVVTADGVTPVKAGIVVHFKSDAFHTVCTADGSHVVCVDVPQGIQEESAVTQADGRFEIPLVNAGRFTLSAEDLQSTLVGQVHAQVAPGQTADLVVRLLNQATVTINVRRNDGHTPVPSALVEVKQITYPQKTLTRRADPLTGSVVLSGADVFSEGDLVVSASDQNGFAGRATGRVKQTDTAIAIDVFLFDASGTVSGTVKRSDQITAVPNADVVIANVKGPLAYTQTDSAGHYSADVIPRGPFTVEVFEPTTARVGYASGQVSFDQEAVAADVTLTAIGEVTGHVLTQGTLAPLSLYNVTLSQTSPSGRALPSVYVTSGVDGGFAFPGVSQGAFAVFAQAHGLYAQAASRLDHEGDVVDVPLIVSVPKSEFGRVEGTIVDPSNAPGNAQVLVCTNACGSASASYQEFRLTADGNGAFAVDHVPVGRLEIVVRSQSSENAGRATALLAFDGDVTRVTIPLVGLARVDGVVTNASPSGARVELNGSPASGCPGPCTVFTGPDGAFSFLDVPAHTVTITATDVATPSRQGVVVTNVNAGSNSVTITLQNAVRLSGTVRTALGAPAQGITAELQAIFSGGNPAFATTDATGLFTFAGLLPGSYSLRLSDPLGPGVAAFNKIDVTNTDVALGDVTLDEVGPSVATIDPPAAALAVPRNQQIKITFSEPLDPATITAAHIVLSGPTGAVPSTLTSSQNDTVVVVSPLALLSEATRYAVQVSGVNDRAGKPLVPVFTAAFTTIDLTPPATTDVSPAAGATSVSINTTVRIAYSEAIDAARLVGAPIVVSKGGISIDGRIDYALGGTVVIFTPARPLEVAARYEVAAQAAFDPAGNRQAAGLSFSFTTSDLTPPKILSLTAASPTVIEGTTDTVVADVGTADVAVVDFSINDVPALAARARPFTLAFEATPSVGRPGDRMKISALATDASGVRATVPILTYVDVIADRPPTAAITAPVDGTNVHNGDRVTVTVHATDDVGVAQIAYRPTTGRAADADSRSVPAHTTDRVETFAFTVPDSLPPGAAIEISATAVDSKGQQTPAAVVRLTILDATAPTVTITGTSTGTVVRPGDNAVAVVSASDAGGVASIQFHASGVAAFDETRPVAPAQPSVAASFTFPVPVNARPTDTIRLDASAADAAGNSASAATVLLSIADLEPPRVTVTTLAGGTSAVIGAPVSVVVHAEDEVGVARIDVRGSGAFILGESRSIAPPSGSATQQFDIQIPPTARPDDVLTIEAVARDVFGNTSAPATLTLTLRTLTDVTLQPSVIVLAGETASIPIAISPAAGAGGVSVKLTTADASVATIASPVAIAAGQTAGTTTVTGVAGGTTTVTASIQGVDRASMTVAVQGPVVSGTAYDAAFNTLTGAQVSVTVGNTVVSTTTDDNGHYEVVGDFGFFTNVSVRITKDALLGVGSGQLNAPHGFAQIDIILLEVGSISGPVRTAGGVAVGAGIRVDLFDQHALQLLEAQRTPLSTTQTADDGTYRFDTVGLGAYYVEARDDATGNRGRATVTLDAGGQQPIVPISYLGRGSVSGSVLRDGQLVSGVVVRLFANSIFGDAPAQQLLTPDGHFRFDNVFVGTATVQATDNASGLAGVATGTIAQDGQTIVTNITLANFGVVSGTVYRADHQTTVPGATVLLEASSRTLTTTTEDNGHFSFATVPFGNFVIYANHPATHGIGRATGAVAAQGQQVSADVVMFPQGRIVATVLTSAQHPAAGASVTVTSTAPFATDYHVETADSSGTVVIENVLAGSYVLTAKAGALQGTANGTLAADETAQVTITLEPTASIAGTVFLPDRVTPTAATLTIQSLVDSTLKRTIEVGPDGAYRIDDLPLHTFEITANDAARPRAKVHVSLAVAGSTASQDVAFTALGTVTGTVVDVGNNNTKAGGVSVLLQSRNPDFPGFTVASTNAAGVYTFPNVYAGPVVVTVTTQTSVAEAHATVPDVDGSTVTLDMQLAPNGIRFPQTRYDGSNATWDVQQDGSLQYGMNFVFNASYPDVGGGFFLDIVRDGAANRFTGSDIGRTELSGSQLVTSQNGLAGLNVTRKVYVPRSHFARYLEILSNPTSSPITVSVRVQHGVTPFGGNTSSVLATSSGDTALDVSDAANPDRWFTFAAAAEGDVFVDNALPTLAWTFDGAGARRRASAVSVTPLKQPNGLLTKIQVAYEWDDVTIPANGVVALLHFGAQQTTRAAARASAERLVQLPPEALDGLTQTEIGAIENFDVPATGLSTLAALPPLTGTVSGHVYEADGHTPIASGQVIRLQSTIPVFARTYRGNVSNGAYHIASGVDPFTTNGWIGIPLSSFTVNGVHPQTTTSPFYPVFTGVAGPTVTGTFAPGETTATVDYAFTNTAMVRATIRRANGTPFTSASSYVSATRTAPAPPPSVSSLATAPSADGTFHLFGLLPGTYHLDASVSLPQMSGGLPVASTVTVAAGDAVQADVLLPATGMLTGTLRTARGVPVGDNNGFLTLRDPHTGNQWTAATNATGVFLFTDVPAGTYSLETRDPQTSLPTTVQVTIVAGQTVTQNMSYTASGTISGRVFDRSGAPMPFQEVDLYVANAGIAGQPADGQGQFTFVNVPAGVFTIVSYDYTTRLLATASGSIVNDGDSVNADLRFQGVALPTSLVDANDFEFDVDTGGNLTGSPDSYFRSAYSLSILTSDAAGNPQTLAFPGRNSATTELDDRQLVIEQTPYPTFGYPAGLKMTRKIYVPGDGYFARYLEIFENTGAAPVSFGASIAVGLRAGTGTSVLDTSSGDQRFDAADNWLITDRAADGLPVLAYVFAGANGAVRPTLAGLGFTPESAYGPFYRWTGLTLQPGQRAVLMHFAVQEIDSQAARAAVDRLEQLPPEALAGLTAAEIAAIKTFAVPPDGSSAVAPFGPSESVTASGRVLEADGTTAISNALVTFGSASPIFRRTSTTTSDATGHFSVTRRVIDRFTLQATHPQTGVLSPVVSDAVTAGVTTAFHDIVFSNTGAIRGVVRTPSGAPVTAGQIVVAGPSVQVTVSIAPDGSFTAGGLAAGTYSLAAIVNGRAAAALSNVVVAAGATTIQDVSLPPTTTLQIVVKAPNGSPLVTGLVYLQTSAEGFQRFVGYTDATGTVFASDVPPGSFTLVAYTSVGAFAGSATGTIAVADAGQTVTVVVQATGSGTLTGRVVAADGTTGVESATVSVIDIASGTYTAFASTDSDGGFTFASVTHGPQGLRVQATAPGASDITAEATVSFSATQTTATVDLTLPLAVVRGAVYRADGVTPATEFGFQAAQAGTNGNVANQYLNPTANAFVVFLREGQFALRAVDWNTGAVAARSGTIADVHVAQTIDLRFSPTANVAGVVRDAAGAPLGFVQVALSSDAAESGYSQGATTEADGTYHITDVPIGAFSLQACQDTYPQFVCQTQIGMLSADQAVTVDISMPAIGTVTGAVKLADGVSPNTSFYDSVHVLAGAAGPLGAGAYATLMGTATYSVSLPVGPVAAFSIGEGGSSVATGVLPSSGPLTMDLTAGADGAVGSFERVAPGDDAVTYNLQCNGSLQNGEDQEPYQSAYAMRVNGVSFDCVEAARRQLNDRQMQYGPFPLGGLQTTRRVFVPSAGGFARYLDTFTNAGSTTVTVIVDIESRFSGVANLAVAPSDTNGTFAVTIDGSNGASGRNVAAHVFAGAGGAVRPLVTFEPLIGPSVYRYQLTVPAGETVTLLHFAVQRAGTDADGARAQAETLANLTDANALSGMTAADKAQVVNFRIQ